MNTYPHTPRHRASAEERLAASRLFAMPSKARLYLIAALALGIVTGLLAARVSPLLLLGALFAALLAVLVARRADIAVLAILVGTTTIFYDSQLPTVGTPVGSFNIADLVLLLSLGIIVTRAFSRTGSFQHTPLDVPLLVFYGVTLLSTVLALSNSSVDVILARRALRIVTYYLVFFVVTNRVREEAHLRLLMRGLTALAVGVAGLIIVQAMVGVSVPFLAGRVETLDTQGVDYTGVTRVLTPGKALVFVAFIAGSARWILERSKSIRIGQLLQLVLLGFALVITFNRSYWVAVAASLVLLAAAVQPRERLRLLRLTVAGILFMVVVSISLSATMPSSRAGRFVSAGMARAATLLHTETSDEGSLRWRYVENEYAVKQIRAHPLLGLGLGARYREFDSRIDYRAADWSKWDPRFYLHNGHLGLAVHTGIAGYAAFFWLSALFLTRALRHWKDVPTPEARATVLGLALVYLAACLTALTSPVFLDWSWTPVLGLMMGVVEVLLATRMAESVPSPEFREHSGQGDHV